MYRVNSTRIDACASSQYFHDQLFRGGHLQAVPRDEGPESLEGSRDDLTGFGREERRTGQQQDECTHGLYAFRSIQALGSERPRPFDQLSVPGHHLALHPLPEGGVQGVPRAEEIPSADLDGLSEHRPIQGIPRDQGGLQHLIGEAAAVLGVAQPTRQRAGDLQLRELGESDRELSGHDQGEKGPAEFGQRIRRVRGRDPDTGVDDQRRHPRASHGLPAGSGPRPTPPSPGGPPERA